MVNDPIADLLTRIRNGGFAKKRFVEVSASKIKVRIVELLVKSGFVQHYMVKDDPKPGVIRIYLKYNRNKDHVIRGLKRLSKPSRAMYVTCSYIGHFLRGGGIVILSTSKGVLTCGEAKSSGVGGKLLCSIW